MRPPHRVRMQAQPQPRAATPVHRVGLRSLTQAGAAGVRLSNTDPVTISNIDPWAIKGRNPRKIGQMGGTSGEIRGRSKIEAYLKYANEVEGYGDLFLSHNPDPRNKKLCKSLMVQDPDAGEWVLWYRLHT